MMVAKRQPRSGFLRILLWVFPITLRFQQIAMIVLYDILSLQALGVVIASACWMSSEEKEPLRENLTAAPRVHFAHFRLPFDPQFLALRTHQSIHFGCVHPTQLHMVTVSELHPPDVPSVPATRSSLANSLYGTEAPDHRL